jgi:hypothetical protein
MNGIYHTTVFGGLEKLGSLAAWHVVDLSEKCGMNHCPVWILLSLTSFAYPLQIRG